MVYRFKYVGDPNDRFSGPDVAVQGGKSFPKDEVVTLEDSDVLLADKLANHSHFVDMSDKDSAKNVEERKKVIEKAEADKAKAEEAQRKADEKDEADRKKRAPPTTAGGEVVPAPRPPGNVTREPVVDAFGGRTVEERTQEEDHTKAGKTKS